MKIEVLVDVKTTLGEGPLWDVEQQRLYWIDASGMRVFRATAKGGEVRAWDVPSRVGSIAIRKDGKGAICSLAGPAQQLDQRRQGGSPGTLLRRYDGQPGVGPKRRALPA